jgi:hypothetical protein
MIRRKSNYVDVLSTNDEQLLLSQITWGRVLLSYVPGQGSPATFRRPNSRRGGIEPPAFAFQADGPANGLRLNDAHASNTAR